MANASQSQHQIGCFSTIQDRARPWIVFYGKFLNGVLGHLMHYLKAGFISQDITGGDQQLGISTMSVAERIVPMAARQGRRQYSGCRPDGGLCFIPADLVSKKLISPHSGKCDARRPMSPCG